MKVKICGVRRTLVYVQVRCGKKKAFDLRERRNACSCFKLYTALSNIIIFFFKSTCIYIKYFVNGS